MNHSVENMNCSYISNIYTDILAFIFGIIIIIRANKYNDDILKLLGGVIIIEHIYQCIPKKKLVKLGLEPKTSV